MTVPAGSASASRIADRAAFGCFSVAAMVALASVWFPFVRAVSAIGALSGPPNLVEDGLFVAVVGVLLGVVVLAVGGYLAASGPAARRRVGRIMVTAAALAHLVAIGNVLLVAPGAWPRAIGHAATIVLVVLGLLVSRGRDRPRPDLRR